MKNFDIEQLQRKNIYKTPDDFFSKMQENVLQKTVQKKTIIPEKPETKVIRLNTRVWYSIAASIALILGLGFFINTLSTNTDDNVLVTENFSQNNSQDAWKPNVNDDAVENQNNLNADANRSIAQNEIASNETDENAAAVSKIQNREIISKPINEPKTQRTRNKENIDKLIVSFTSSELADVSKNTDMDVYLDLYN